MKLVLIAVLLQLCLSVLDVSAGGGGAAAGGRDLPGVVVQENQLQFGDLLVFPGESYNHYAVYVDNQDFGQGPGQNIFEMTRNPPGCHFSQFRGPFRRHNYLDPGIAQGREPLQPQNEQQMIATIQRLRQDPVCQTYRLDTRNCEQIATKVRYGESHCIQEGASKSIQDLAKVLPKGSVHRREASAAA